MSDDRTELIEELLSAFSRGDMERVRELAHPELELHDLETLPDSDVYRGIDAFVGWRERLTEQFESFEFSATNVEPVGDLLVSDMRARARGKGSGAEVELKFAAVWGFRDGLSSYHHGYANRERALEAAHSAAQAE